LLERLLAATGVGSAGLALATACGGEAKVGQVAHTDGQSGEAGIAARGAGGAARGGSGGSSGNGSGGDVFGTGGNPFATGGAAGTDAGQTPSVTVCVSPHDAGADSAPDSGLSLCDQAKQAIGTPDYYHAHYCEFRGTATVNVAGPKMVGAACCYDVFVTCFVYVGRAFLVDEGLLKAAVRRGGGWRTGPSPCTEGLSPKTRRALTDAWVKDGLFEHASVATFARFAMQLLAVGAPSRLLRETLAAGRDEIRHAELCFALASAYAGEPLEPDCFPIQSDVRVNTDLVAIVEETIVEGCIGETLAALQAAEQARRATDPAVVASLESTVEDETRHAELAWRVTAWALETGGDRVRRAVERTFADFRPPDAPTIDLEGVSGDDFVAHGRLSPDEARATALEALERVVRPCAAALLGLDVMKRRPATPLAPAV
jgi:hypothetical protein